MFSHHLHPVWKTLGGSAEPNPLWLPVSPSKGTCRTKVWALFSRDDLGVSRGGIFSQRSGMGRGLPEPLPLRVLLRDRLPDGWAPVSSPWMHHPPGFCFQSRWRDSCCPALCGFPAQCENPTCSGLPGEVG